MWEESNYRRRVYLSDTDAAGVVYFTRLLSICHEAYEYSLSQAGINLKQLVSNPLLAIPITHAEIDFLRPICCGDELIIEIRPLSISENSFEIGYRLFMSQELVGKAMTRHVAIHPVARRKSPLPSNIIEWLAQKKQ